MIRDDTNKKVLVARATPVRGIFRQAFGLQFRARLDDEGWVFELPWASSWDVTNLFVFQDIDVIWLDKHQKVLKKETVPSWKPHVPGRQGTRFLIELPSGRASSVRIGDAISWDYS